MKERGIIFDAESMRANLAGRKTQTRRVIEPQPVAWLKFSDEGVFNGDTNEWSRIEDDLLKNQVQGIWQKGVRGLVSIERRKGTEGLSCGVFVPQQPEDNKVSASLGVSWDATEQNDAGSAFGWRSGEQPAGESTMGNPVGELARQESTRNSDSRRETSGIKIYEYGTGTYSLGDTKRAMQPKASRDDFRGISSHGIRNCPFIPRMNLWARETWNLRKWSEDGDYDDWMGPIPKALPTGGWVLNYLMPDIYDFKWRSPRFMPRWAARFVAAIVAVKVERVQDISEADALAEGIDLEDGDYHTPVPMFSTREAYRERWDAINGKRAPWADNPWVWCITYQATK